MSNAGAPRFVVVEGPIGVGKTSLAKRLAESLGGDTLLEAAEENPFLERYYQNPEQAALPTQLFFLFQRARQLQQLRQTDMFAPVRVADFMMEKDRLFAQLTLADDELQLYELAYNSITLDVPQPDLVVYLQAPVNVLLNRVQKRGRPFEQHMDAGYLSKLVDVYTRFFHYYSDSPLLIVNAAEIEMLLDRVYKTRSGRHYFNPLPF
jgi:deoxyguanosine kinase